MGVPLFVHGLCEKWIVSRIPGTRLSMLYKTLSAAVYGIDANIIQVEVDCSGIKCDQDHFHTVGLPDAAVRESRDPCARRPEELRLRYPADPDHH